MAKARSRRRRGWMNSYGNDRDARYTFRMRLYTDLAELWPLLSPPEDYESEAALLHGMIQTHLPGREDIRVLELGAGGGHTLCHLADHYACTAVDLSGAMLALCRKLIPQVRTVEGDMRTVRLGETFDVVLIHDAIDYMTTPADVAATLETIKAHLAPDGLAFIAPTYLAETFDNHAIESDSNGDPETGRVLAYTSYVSRLSDEATTFEMILVYFIHDEASESGAVRVVEDRHVCGLFGQQQWHDMIREAGLSSELHTTDDDMPFNMFVCREA